MFSKSLNMMDFDKLDDKLKKDGNHLLQYCKNYEENLSTKLAKEYCEKYLDEKIKDIIKIVHDNPHRNSYFFYLIPKYSRFWFHKMGDTYLGGSLIVLAVLVFLFIVSFTACLEHGLTNLCYIWIPIFFVLLLFIEECYRNYYKKMKSFANKYEISYDKIIDEIENRIDIQIFRYSKEDCKFCLVKDKNKRIEEF